MHDRAVETIDHSALKSLAIAWLFSQRCRVVATEVTTAVPRWRVDAAGWREGGLRDESIAVECKQSRADFFRDDEQRDELVAERDRLLAKRRQLEESRLKVFEPHLCRRDESLFTDAADWDFTASRDDGYRRVLLDLRRVDQRLHGQTKFCLMTRYRLADRLYILAPRGMLRPREIPEGWGLLEALRDDSRRTNAADGDRGIARGVRAPCSESCALHRDQAAGHRPYTSGQAPVAQSDQSSRLLSGRSVVRIHAGALPLATRLRQFAEKGE